MSDGQSATDTPTAALPTNFPSSIAQRAAAVRLTCGGKWSKPTKGSLDSNCTANKKESADKTNGFSFTSECICSIYFAGLFVALLKRNGVLTRPWRQNKLQPWINQENFQNLVQETSLRSRWCADAYSTSSYPVDHSSDWSKVLT